MKRARRYALEAKLAVVVSAVVRRLPRRLVLALGRRLGRIWGALDKRHLRIAADNLRQAFPEWDEERVLRTARGVYAHFGEDLGRLHERRMQTWMRSRPKQAFGSHSYDPSDFGWTYEELAEENRDYRERYQISRE